MASAFEDGEVYENPFLAMLSHGEVWAASGMAVGEMTAAAIQLGGAAIGRNASENLTGFANEFITRQQAQGER